MEGDNSRNILTAAQCIDAGMYWFGQSDLDAANAWWRRALELEPDNVRAQECLRLLQKTSSTGYKHDSWARLPALDEEEQPMPLEPRPLFDHHPLEEMMASSMRESEAITDELLPDLVDEGATPLDHFPEFSSTPQASLASGQELESEARRLGELRQVLQSEPDPPFFDTGEELDFVTEPLPTSSEDLDVSSLSQSSEMLKEGGNIVSDALTAGTNEMMSEYLSEETEDDDSLLLSHSPWDDGPSKTSVVTIRHSGEFDAVADPTPLPEEDREAFFNRPRTPVADEALELLLSSNDLPSPEESGRDWLSAPSGGLEDALNTEPATSSKEAHPSVALEAARTRFQLHDFQGVVDALDRYPQDAGCNTEVRNMLAEARVQLLRMYEAKIGSLEQVPDVLVSSEEIIWLNLNHRAGFILSQVDGVVTYDDLISLSGMSRLDTVRIFAELIEQKVIGVRTPKPGLPMYHRGNR